MTDIQQSYSLDASQAIGSLTTLDQSVQRVSASISTLKRTSSGRVSTPFDDMAAGAGKANKAVGQARDEFGRFASTGTESIQQVTVSWETLARVVQTQLIVRALNQVIDGFFAAADAAAEFQLQAARISSISDFDTGGAQDAIQELSRSVGRSVGESGEALFEALQNDLGTAEQTIGLLQGQASDLALLTGGTLPQAVNALSSVIKSYNVDLADAAEITPILFGAIDAGRITLADLENSLGTILPLARQVGVTTREVAAGIATITRGGTDAATATTQLRNVFNKAIKPTAELSAVYRELGVDGFQALVEESGGFIEALTAITDQLGGNETAIAKAFNTIRGSLGVFNVLRDGGNDFATVMDVIDNKAAEVAESIEAIEDTDARRLERAMADLDNTMVELGESALAIKTTFLELFTDVISDGTDAALAMAGLGAGAATATVSVFGLQGAVTGLGVALSRLGPAALVTGGILAGIWAINKIEEYEAGLGGIQDQVEKINQLGADEAQRIIRQQEVDRVKDLSDNLRDADSRLNTLLRSARVTAGEIEIGFDEATKSISGAFASATDTATGFMTSTLDNIKSQLDDLDKTIADSRNAQRDAQQSLDDFDFQQRIKGLGDVQKAEAALTRAQEARTEQALAIEALRTGSGSIEEVRRLSDIAETRAKEATSMAESADNAGVLNRALANQRGVLENNVTAAERYTESLEGIDRSEADRSILDTRRAVTDLSGDMELARDLMVQLADARASGAQDTLIESLESQLTSLVDKIQRDGQKILQSDAFDLFGGGEAAEAAAKNFERRLSNIQVDWSKTVSGLQDQLDQQELTIGARIILEELEGVSSPGLQEALRGARTENPARSVEQQVEAARAFNEEQGKIQSELQENRSQIRQQSRAFDQFYQQASAGARGFRGTLLEVAGTVADPDFLFNQRETVKSILEPYSEAIGNISELTRPELVELRNQIAQSVTDASQKGLLPTVEGDVLNALNEVGDVVQARIDSISLEEAADTEGLRESNELIKSLGEPVTTDVDFSTIEQTSAKSIVARRDVASIGDGGAQAGRGLASLLGVTNSLAGAANNAAAAFQAMAAAAAAAAAAARAAASAGGGGATNANYGGAIRYLANGGTRGRDTQAAMVDPQEFIMNARSSRNFFSELQAMNAGRAPSQQSDSGVTNINIGDVNVNSPSQAAASQARDIGNSLRRELRRRTFKL